MKKQTSEYRKTFIVAFLLIFVFLSVTAYSLYANFIEIKDKEYTDENNEHFIQACENLDGSLRAAKSIATVLFNDDSIIEYSHEAYKNYESIDFENLLQISKEIALMQSCFLYADFSIAVTKLNDNMMVINDRTTSLEKGLKDLNISRKNIEEAFGDSDSGGIWFELMIDKANGGLTLLAKNNYGAASDIYIIFSFNAERFFENGKGSYLLFNDVGIIAKKSEISSGEQAKCVDEILENFDQINKDELINIFFDAKVYRCAYTSEVFSDCTYVYIYDNKEYILSYIFIFLFVFAAAYIISLYATKFMYKPILNALHFFGDEVDYYDCLHTLKDKINNLLDERSDYLMQIEEEKQKLKNNFLLDLINGILNDKQTKEKILEFGIEYLNGESICVLIGFDDTLNNDLVLEKRKYEIEEGIIEYISNKIITDFCGDIIKLNAHTYACIIKYSLELEDSFVLLLDEINELYEKRVIVAIGKKAENGLYMYDSYFDALGILENQRAKKMFGVFVNEDIHQSNNIYYPLSVEQNLIEHVIRDEEEKTQMLLKHIFAKNFEYEFIENNMRMMFEMAIVLTIKRVIYQLDIEEKDVFEDGTVIYLELKMAKTKDELEKKVIELFDRIFLYVHQQNSVQGKDNGSFYGKRIMEYIDENYLRDISLSDISEALGISVSLICKVLKEEYNTTFKIHTNRKKITKACEMIRESPNMKIKNISSRLGFNCTATFARLFKKYEGVTPDEYKKIISGKKEN